MVHEPTRLIKFGDGADAYNFPASQTDVGWNFSDVASKITKLPGVSGGFDEYGSGIAPTEIGNVRVTFRLYKTGEAFDRGEMHALRDAVAKMVDMGKQRLWLSPGNQGQRWCYARVNSVNWKHDPSGTTDQIQTVTINFQASDPYWYALGSDAVWGSSEWGDAQWGGVTPIECDASVENATLSVGGNVMTQPLIIVGPVPSGSSCTNPTIERIVNAVVVDRVRLETTLTVGMTAVFDARKLSVTRNGVSFYNSSFSYLHPSWFRLLPGNNSVRVRFDSITAPTNDILVYFKWFVKFR